MKYSDGFWMNKSGYDVNYATQIYEVKATDNSITVYATNQWIGNRGMTLGGPVLEITFTSTLADSIKVTIEHYKGAVKKGPDFTLYEDANFKPVINEKDEYWELVSNKTSVRIGKAGGAWDIKYFYDGKLLTKEGWRTTSYIEEQPWLTDYRMEGTKAERFYAHASTDEPARIREMLNISVGENIYGFGEKFSTFVKNGQTVEVWNNDGGTCSEQTYKSIPFYVSSRNYGVFVNHPENVTFEVASETVSKVAFSVQGERMEYFVMGGKTIADVLGVYTTLTGKPALPPAYTFGLWLTTSFTTNYDEETVSFFIDEMARRDIPLEVFHFDCFWMKEFNWCDFTWDKRMFPDPKAMLARLKEKKIEICVWINPYIAQQSSLFDEGVKNGYFIKKTDGGVFQCDMWQPGMAIVDFTNPEACKWYKAKLRTLCDSRRTSVREYPQPMLYTATALILTECTTTTHISTTSAYLRCLRNSTARIRLVCSHVLLRSAVSSSLYTGAATASASTNQWLKHSVEDFHSAYQALATLATIFRALRLQAHPTYTRDGLHSALCLHTQDFTATAHTEYRGTLTKKRAMFCATSQSSRAA